MIWKIQNERRILKDLLTNIYKEVTTEGAFKCIIETVESDRKREALLRDARANVKRIVEEIKNVNEEIAEQLEERKRDEQSQSQVIEKLKEDLQELKVIFIGPSSSRFKSDPLNPNRLKVLLKANITKKKPKPI